MGVMLWLLNSYGVFLLIILTLLFLAYKKDHKLFYNSLIAIIVTLLVTVVLKELVDRPRPYELMSVVSQAGADYLPSFPSGHAALAFSLATSVIVGRKLFGVLLMILAAIISLGRVVALVHYPTDIAFGMLVGVFVALFVSRYKVQFSIKRKKRS